MTKIDVFVSFAEQSVDSPTVLSGFVQTMRPGDEAQVGWVDQRGAQHTAIIRLTTGPPQ